MSLMDTLRQKIMQWLLPDEWMQSGRKERLLKYETRRAYYDGRHPRTMKVKPGQPDDNVTMNFVKLIVDRSIALMLGQGIKFDLPGDDSTEQDFIDNTWRANKQQLTIMKACRNAAVYGYGYFKIIPNGITDSEAVFHRIVPLDSRWMSFKTDPEDEDVVIEYENRFNIRRGDETIARKELTTRETRGVANEEYWIIRNFEATKASQGRWVLTDETEWPYPFPPIKHWENLPGGESDIDDVLEINDRVNFIASNINRIIRYHAHPKTWGRGLAMGQKASWGADEMVLMSGDGQLANLEMQSDLQSSANYLLMLRQALFDIARTVDITSLSDKLGALTNFGLRVLFADAIAKNAVKRELAEEALLAINQRLLVLSNFQNIDPGDVIWPDTLPTDELQDLQAAQVEIGLGLVSKQTAAKERGRDWEEESARIEEEAAAGDNIGAALIRAFNQGQ